MLFAWGNGQSDNKFDETFAPAFRLDSLRMLVAIAAQLGEEEAQGVSSND